MQDLKEFREKLAERRAYLVQKLEQFEASLEQPRTKDIEDRATEMENEEVIEGLGVTGLEELRRIDRALLRIDDGTYGVCANCGEDIPVDRLRIVPEAQTCVRCMAR
ncbi:MAG: TraR/DksA family transcriptional regulator [Pseudomonadota bacterium]